MNDQNFKPGDVVCLKSEGPVMTIDEIVKDGHTPERGDYARCCWFDENNVSHNEKIRTSSLKHTN